MAFEELNTKFYTEKSVLDVLKLIQWKKDSKKYNFEALPKTAIITLQNSFLDKKTRIFAKKLKGIAGKNYQINKDLLVCTSFGNGAPAIVGLLEELRGLGVENFIFIGFAGSLTTNFKENEVCIVTKSYSTTGSAILYSSNDYFEPKKSEWFSNFQSKLNYKESICWSTDAPFRETASLIDHYKNKKATHVDMECAAIYAFAEFYNLNVICILITSDSLSDEGWKLPKNLELLNSTMKKVVKQFINIFLNE